MQRRILVGTRKGLFVIEGGGGRWRTAGPEFPGVPVSMVLHDPRDRSTYAALAHGHFGCKLHRAVDGKMRFEEIAVPVYPEKPADFEDVDPWRKKPRLWSLQQIWSLEAGGDAGPGVLWAGTIPGGLFRSDDAGASWQLMRALWDDEHRRQWSGGGYDDPGIHSICVDPRDPRHLVVGVSVGGVWRSRDGGQNFELCGQGMRADYMPPERAYEQNAQDPHRIVQCRAEPDTYWCQHHNGVLCSDDGALNWREITDIQPSTFGFAVVVHPLDPKQAWFVPATSAEARMPVGGAVVVSMTADGGRSFSRLTNGLPQEHAFDIVYRHALDIDDQGQCLAFGSTSGALWISEDQGGTWQTVHAHLPPIYVVRYA